MQASNTQHDNKDNDCDEMKISSSLILYQQGLHNDKYDGNGDDDGEVIKSDDRNDEAVEGGHHSYYQNSDGYIYEQGGRTLVGFWPYSCDDPDGDVNDNG